MKRMEVSNRGLDHSKTNFVAFSRIFEAVTAVEVTMSPQLFNLKRAESLYHNNKRHTIMLDAAIFLTWC